MMIPFCGSVRHREDYLCLHVRALGGGEDALLVFIYVNMDARTTCTFRSFP